MYLWSTCTDRETAELEDHWIVALFGDGGPDALIRAGLAERTESGKVRVKGTDGRIEWLKTRRESARKGGEARKSQSQAKAKPNGSQVAPKAKPKPSQVEAKAKPSGTQEEAKRDPNGSQEQAKAKPSISSSYSSSLLSEERSPGGEVPPPKEKTPRPPNPLFDAVAEVTRSDPVVTGAHVGKITTLLSRADPPYTPDEVREFGRRFHEFCPWARKDGSHPTLGTIEKYIGALRERCPLPPTPEELQARRDEAVREQRERMARMRRNLGLDAPPEDEPGEVDRDGV